MPEDMQGNLSDEGVLTPVGKEEPKPADDGNAHLLSAVK